MKKRCCVDCDSPIDLQRRPLSDFSDLQQEDTAGPPLHQLTQCRGKPPTPATHHNTSSQLMCRQTSKIDLQITETNTSQNTRLT